MRRVLLACALTAAAACSSSPPTATTPPPPSPPSATPASDAVQAGNGQQAEPGDTLPVRPAIIVKAASGAPVGGVSVAFTVDSGGGSLSATTATTGANGVATAGAWTLGPAEGRNALEVTVANLAPLTITAVAIVSGGSFPQATTPASGGSIMIVQPGPLNGFALNVPAASYATPTNWNISYQSAATVTWPAVVSPVSPVIHITGSATSYSANLLTITVPAAIPAGTFPVVVARDPVSGLIEVLPTISYDSESVTAVTRHLNGGFLLGNTAATVRAPVRGGAIRSGSYDIEVVLSALTPAQLNSDVDTGFRPGTDDWGFRNDGTYFQPNGTCGGMSVTAMWYYANQKGSDGPLSHRFELAAGVPVSDRDGQRWASKVNAAQPEGVFAAALNASVTAAKATPGLTPDQVRYDLIKAELYVTQLPQLIIVGSQDAQFSRAVMAYRTAGSDIYIADPNVPGGLNETITFIGGRFVPYSMASTNASSAPVLMTFVGGIAASAVYDWTLFPGEYDEVVAGTIDQSVYPATQMYNRFGALGDTVYLADTMVTWVQCATCQPLLPLPPGLTGPTAPIALISLFANPGGGAAWLPNVQNSSSVLFNPTKVSQGDHPLGYAPTGLNTAGPGWLDWKTFTLRALQGSVTPASSALLPGDTVAFTMQVTPNTLPSHVVYQWNFGDSTATANVPDNAAVKHIFTGSGSFAPAASILDATTQQPIAKATATVSVRANPAWRLTALNQIGESGPEPATHFDTIYNLDVDTLAAVRNQMNTLAGNASDGLIVFFNQFYRDSIGVEPNLLGLGPVTNGDEVGLQIAPSGTGGSLTTWTGGPSFGVWELAVACNVPPDEQVLCGSNTLTSTGTLLNGTVVGLGGRLGWLIGPPNIIGDWLWWQVNATMNGRTLSGTITFTMRVVDFYADAFVGTHTITWSFTATMVR